ncbi:MAG: hypothetical protein J0H17_13850 [Rhizobiales bacterium]|nr:hypothetical protein [Hyphomicrobiales bacterium]
MSDTTIRQMLFYKDGLRDAAGSVEYLIDKRRAEGADAVAIADLQDLHASIVHPLAQDDHDVFLVCGPVDGVHRRPTFRSAA